MVKRVIFAASPNTAELQLGLKCLQHGLEELSSGSGWRSWP